MQQHVLVSGYKTYVILDGTRSITAATADAAVAAMKESGMFISFCCWYLHTSAHKKSFVVRSLYNFI